MILTDQQKQAIEKEYAEWESVQYSGKDKKERQKLGQFFTPPVLTIRMLEKFDCIIMNPPYERNLHLKILAEAIKHLNNENSVCVNLSPIRWLQDPLAKLKASNGVGGIEDENFILKHIKSLSEIKYDVAGKIFNSGQGSNLAIYICCLNEVNFDTSIFENPILNKIIPYIKTKNTILKNGKLIAEQYCVKIPHVYGAMGTGLYISPNRDISRNLIKSAKSGTRTLYLNFKTNNEAENCRLSFLTTFWKYLTLTTKTSANVVKILPYMSDYTEPWTNERFCKYFNISGFISDTKAEPNSEWETILKTIEKFK